MLTIVHWPEDDDPQNARIPVAVHVQQPYWQLETPGRKCGAMKRLPRVFLRRKCIALAVELFDDQDTICYNSELVEIPSLDVMCRLEGVYESRAVAVLLDLKIALAE
eukprot:3482550-Rhodomonas_salina.3